MTKPATPDAAYDAALAAHQEAQAAYDSAQSAFKSAMQNWSDESDKRREALDLAIAAYNARFAALYINNWTQFSVRHTERQSQVSFSDPSRLAAGGNLTLLGEQFINDKSHIAVGGALVGALDKLSNIEAIGQHIIEESGTSQYTRSQWRGGFRRYHQRKWGPVLAYAPADVVTSIKLPVTQFSENLCIVPIDKASAAAQNNVQAIVERDLNAPNSIFKLNQDNLGPLLATDQRFTQYRQWLGSDYMLQKMGNDPSLTQKRLGDGFAEQKLVREQIAQLTGRRFLEGYASDEAQYAALMDQGATYAKAWQLRPGIALSAEQVSQLTSDMVWLVEQSVSIPGQNGQPATLQKVLVPQIYLIPRAGDLHADGSLITAGQIDLQLNDELHNSGTIAGRTVVSIHAGTINNRGGSIAANSTIISTDKNINNIGGNISAENNLLVHAGGDLNIVSTTQSSTKNTQGNSNSNASRTNLDRIAGLYVTGPNGVLIATANQDIKLQAADVANAGSGSAVLAAGRDLHIGAVATGHQTSSTDRRDPKNYLRDGHSEDVGSHIHTNGALTLSANQDIRTTAADIISDKGSIAITAGGGIAITAGEASRQTAQGTHIESSGFLSSSAITTSEKHDSSRVVESVISGDTVHIEAGKNLQVKGSQVVSSQSSTLTAGGNLSIESATETAHDASFQRKTTSGLIGGNGLSVSIGRRSEDNTSEITSSIEHSSTVGSLNGNVELKAGGQYRQSASQVITPAGSVLIDATRINITTATQESNARAETRIRQTGVTLAVSNPVVSAVQTVNQLGEAARNTKDSRSQALAAAAATLTVANTATALKQDPSAAASVTVSLSLGTSQSSANSLQHTQTAASSTVAAAQNVTMKAHGAGQDSSLTIHGSQIMAGNDASLHADGALLLDAQANTASQTSSNKSSSAGIGVSASIGAKNKLGLTVTGSLGRGHADGDDLAWTNTEIQAGNKATLQSGGDAILKGAVVSAHRVEAQIDGNLHIESLQESSNYKSKQQNISGSATIGPASSGNLSLNHSKVDSTYTSVTEQSGIKSGDGGFGVAVKGGTDLKGGVISSTEAAVQGNQNNFSTKTLSLNDVQNRAAYSANATGVSVGAGVSTDGKLAPAGTSVGLGHDSDSNSSITQAGISGIAGNQAVRTGDKSGGIAKLFDAVKVEKDINAQVFITQTFSREAPRAVANYADSQIKRLQEQAKNETEPARQAALRTDISHWQDGGAYRVALHAAAGGMAGGVGGAVGAGTAAAAAPLLNAWQEGVTAKLKAAGASDQVANAAGALIAQTTAAGMGAVASGGTVQGAAAGFNVDANNRVLHMVNFDRLRNRCRTSSTTECQTINRMGGVRSGMPEDDSKIPASKVVSNFDSNGNVVSYTLIDRNSNQPTMIMEPLDFAAYRNGSPGIQAMMKLSPQYVLDFASAGLYASQGEPNRAAEHVVAGVTSRDYVRDVTLSVAGAAVSAASGVKPNSPALRPESQLGSANRGSLDTLQSEADFAGRGTVRTDLGDHLVNPQMSGKQISGGHNINEFNMVLNKAGGTVVSKVETGPGIYEIQYQLPNSNKPAVKTVFDPVRYPNMENMANTAANRALLEYQLTGNSAPIIQVNGINFDVRIAVRPGEPPSVRTAFPVGSAK